MINFNNFNFSHKNEYLLNHSMIRECIHLYGIPCKFVIIQKVNFDQSVFGDYSAIKTNNSDTFMIHMLPENAEDIDKSQYEFNEFGLNNYDTTMGYISTSDLPEGLNITNLTGNLMVFPSNQIMEISDCEQKVPGINNLWAYSDQVSVYRLTLKPYERRAQDEIDNESVLNTVEVKDNGPVDVAELNSVKEIFDSLDGYFDTLLNEKEEQDYQAEFEPFAESKEDETGTEIVEENHGKPIENPKTMKQKIKNKDRRVIKPVVDISEKDPFNW